MPACVKLLEQPLFVASGAVPSQSALRQSTLLKSTLLKPALSCVILATSSVRCVTGLREMKGSMPIVACSRADRGISDGVSPAATVW